MVQKQNEQRLNEELIFRDFHSVIKDNGYMRIFATIPMTCNVNFENLYAACGASKKVIVRLFKLPPPISLI